MWNAARFVAFLMWLCESNKNYCVKYNVLNSLNIDAK
jgi:hypothetical protein